MALPNQADAIEESTKAGNVLLTTFGGAIIFFTAVRNRNEARELRL